MSDNFYNAEEAKAESVEKKEYSPGEIKAIKAAELFISVSTCLNAGYALLQCFLENKGARVLFIFGGLSIAVAVIAVLYTALFFKSLIKIEAYRKRYLISGILLIWLVICHIILSYDYVADIFGGTKTVVTRDYSCTIKEPIFLRFADENGEEHSMKISAETKRELENNPYSDEVSQNSYRYLKKNYITVEFYPNSMVLVKAEIE